VLSDGNRQSEAEWHAYIAAVYGAPLPVGETLDLNALTWFYTGLAMPTAAPTAAHAAQCDERKCTSLGNDCCAPGTQPRTCSGGWMAINLEGDCFGHADARYTCCSPDADAGAVRVADLRSKGSNSPPARLIRDSPCLGICVVGLSTPTYEGTPWVGRGTAASAHFAEIGYFVRRPLISPSDIRSCTRLEVGHLRTTYKGGEKGVSWFFHNVGSGVFLDCAQLPTRGRIGAYRDRKDFGRVEGEHWANDESFPSQWMRRRNVAMIVFTQADFAQYGFRAGANPRTEIIVRHRQDSSSEVHMGERGVCLEASSIGIKTFAGWHGSRACDCRPLNKGGYSFLRCA